MPEKTGYSKPKPVTKAAIGKMDRSRKPAAPIGYRQQYKRTGKAGK